MTRLKKPTKRIVVNSTDKYVGGRMRMRRLMLAMSQETLGEAFGVSFQQIQKYEKGKNRISASRLQHAAEVLQVPVSFFFDGAPSGGGETPAGEGATLLPTYVNDFVASSDGLRLIMAFERIKSAKMRRCIVDFVQEIAPERTSESSVIPEKILTAASP